MSTKNSNDTGWDRTSGQCVTAVPPTNVVQKRKSCTNKHT